MTVIKGWLFRLGVSAWLVGWWLSGVTMAQETEPASGPESLRLPEVVITGIDRSKIQRMIPKIDVAPDLTLIVSTTHDRAEALVQQGDAAFGRQIRQAEELYRQATTSDPSYAAAYARLGDAYRAQSKYVEAAEAYQQALALNAGLVDVYAQLGALYEDHLQDAEQALGQYRLYVQTGGADPRVNIWIRDITRQLAGDTSETPTE